MGYTLYALQSGKLWWNGSVWVELDHERLLVPFGKAGVIKDKLMAMRAIHARDGEETGIPIQIHPIGAVEK